jgi:acetyl esterase/lipase
MKNLMLAASLLAGFLSVTSLHAEDPKAILLWPNGAPGSEGKTGEEKIRNVDNGERVFSNIHKPNITPYLPSPDKATGCAIVVAPGGGHRELWADHEGHFIAKWLSEHGVAAFVIKYRLARETNSTYTVDEHSLGDMQRAIRTVRSRAKEWNLSKNRIGVMGFSAGGEVAFLSAMRFDSGAADSADAIARESCKPDFQVLVYPGRLQRIEVSTNSPPAFLIAGYNDRADISEGLANVYVKFKQAKVPAELHMYSGSGHGFGYRSTDPKPVGKWLERLHEWMGDTGFLKDR